MDIVEGLRTAMDLTPFYDTKALHREAADLIVSLRRERDAAQAMAKDMSSSIGLSAQMHWKKRAESAEAEVARLREALGDLVSWFPVAGTRLEPPSWRIAAGPYGADDAIAAARTALEADNG